VLHFATGAAFFSGMLLANSAAVPAFWLRQRLLKRTLGGHAALGILFVMLSATPIAWYAYAIWLAVAAASVAVACAVSLPRRLSRLRPVLAAILLSTSSAICLAEARYWRLPSIESRPREPIVVIGDSLSAGVGAGTDVWPEVYARQSGRVVVNLAEPGATLKAALRQAADLPEAPGVVVLEIGGNDLLGGVGIGDFREALDRLLAAVRRDGRQLVMFELPLPPFHGAYGVAQRSLAAKHGVTMIPKRCLGAALGLKGATLDGLHFSQTGHDYVAELIARVIRHATPATSCVRR